MKILLKTPIFLLGLMTSTVAHPALADSTADLILSLKCPNEYTVNIWKRYGSEELLYRGFGPIGQLSLGKGNSNSTGVADVYKFKNGDYEYSVLKRKRETQGRGTVEVFKKGRSILALSCTEN
jgi:hypothetical protein